MKRLVLLSLLCVMTAGLVGCGWGPWSAEAKEDKPVQAVVPPTEAAVTAVTTTEMLPPKPIRAAKPVTPAPAEVTPVEPTPAPEPVKATKPKRKKPTPAKPAPVPTVPEMQPVAAPTNEEVRQHARQMADDISRRILATDAREATIVIVVPPNCAPTK